MLAGLAAKVLIVGSDVVSSGEAAGSRLTMAIQLAALSSMINNMGISSQCHLPFIIYTSAFYGHYNT
jgi:hypothetical protein